MAKQHNLYGKEIHQDSHEVESSQPVRGHAQVLIAFNNWFDANKNQESITQKAIEKLQGIMRDAQGLDEDKKQALVRRLKEILALESSEIAAIIWQHCPKVYQKAVEQNLSEARLAVLNEVSIPAQIVEIRSFDQPKPAKVAVAKAFDTPERLQIVEPQPVQVHHGRRVEKVKQQHLSAFSRNDFLSDSLFVEDDREDRQASMIAMLPEQARISRTTVGIRVRFRDWVDSEEHDPNVLEVIIKDARATLDDSIFDGIKQHLISFLNAQSDRENAIFPTIKILSFFNRDEREALLGALEFNQADVSLGLDRLDAAEVLLLEDAADDALTPEGFMSLLGSSAQDNKAALMSWLQYQPQFLRVLITDCQALNSVLSLLDTDLQQQLLGSLDENLSSLLVFDDHGRARDNLASLLEVLKPELYKLLLEKLDVTIEVDHAEEVLTKALVLSFLDRHFSVQMAKDLVVREAAGQPDINRVHKQPEIKDFATLLQVLKALATSDEQISLITRLADELPHLITDFEGLTEICQVIDQRSEATLIQCLKDKLPALIDGFETFYLLLHGLVPSARIKLLEALQTQIPDWIKQYDNLYFSFVTQNDSGRIEPLDAASQLKLIEILKPHLAGIITSSDEFYNILYYAHADARIALIEALKGQMSDLTQQKLAGIISIFEQKACQALLENLNVMGDFEALSRVVDCLEIGYLKDKQPVKAILWSMCQDEAAEEILSQLSQKQVQTLTTAFNTILASRNQAMRFVKSNDRMSISITEIEQADLEEDDDREVADVSVVFEIDGQLSEKQQGLLERYKSLLGYQLNEASDQELKSIVSSGFQPSSEIVIEKDGNQVKFIFSVLPKEAPSEVTGDRADEQNSALPMPVERVAQKAHNGAPAFAKDGTDSEFDVLVAKILESEDLSLTPAEVAVLEAPLEQRFVSERSQSLISEYGKKDNGEKLESSGFEKILDDLRHINLSILLYHLCAPLVSKPMRDQFTLIQSAGETLVGKLLDDQLGLSQGQKEEAVLVLQDWFDYKKTEGNPSVEITEGEIAVFFDIKEAIVAPEFSQSELSYQLFINGGGENHDCLPIAIGRLYDPKANEADAKITGWNKIQQGLRQLPHNELVKLASSLIERYKQKLKPFFSLAKNVSETDKGVLTDEIAHALGALSQFENIFKSDEMIDCLAKSEKEKLGLMIVSHNDLGVPGVIGRLFVDFDAALREGKIPQFLAHNGGHFSNLVPAAGQVASMYLPYKNIEQSKAIFLSLLPKLFTAAGYTPFRDSQPLIIGEEIRYETILDDSLHALPDEENLPIIGFSVSKPFIKKQQAKLNHRQRKIEAQDGYEADIDESEHLPFEVFADGGNHSSLNCTDDFAVELQQRDECKAQIDESEIPSMNHARKPIVSKRRTAFDCQDHSQELSLLNVKDKKGADLWWQRIVEYCLENDRQPYGQVMTFNPLSARIKQSLLSGQAKSVTVKFSQDLALDIKELASQKKSDSPLQQSVFSIGLKGKPKSSKAIEAFVDRAASIINSRYRYEIESVKNFAALNAEKKVPVSFDKICASVPTLKLKLQDIAGLEGEEKMQFYAERLFALADQGLWVGDVSGSPALQKAYQGNLEAIKGRVLDYYRRPEQQLSLLFDRGDEKDASNCLAA